MAGPCVRALKAEGSGFGQSWQLNGVKDGGEIGMTTEGEEGVRGEREGGMGWGWGKRGDYSGFGSVFLTDCALRLALA